MRTNKAQQHKTAPLTLHNGRRERGCDTAYQKRRHMVSKGMRPYILQIEKECRALARTNNCTTELPLDTRKAYMTHTDE